MKFETESKANGQIFHSRPIYDDKYIKTKVKTFNDVVHTIFQGDKIPKEGIHYTCIALINIDSDMKVDNKYYPQVYLEECKYAAKKKKMTSFIDSQLKTNCCNSVSEQYVKLFKTCCQTWLFYYFRHEYIALLFDLSIVFDAIGCSWHGHYNKHCTDKDTQYFLIIFYLQCKYFNMCINYYHTRNSPL